MYIPETIEVNGRNYKVEIKDDTDCDAPWDFCTPLGEVSDWVYRDKYPSERILNTDHSSKRFYDWGGAVREARSQGMSGPDAVKAANQEYEYFRRWCNDDWRYVGVIVTLLDDDDNETDFSDSLWGVESDADEHIVNEVIPDCISQIEYEIKKLESGAV